MKGAVVGVVTKMGEAQRGLLESSFVENLQQWRLLAGPFHDYDLNIFIRLILSDSSIYPERRPQRIMPETLSQVELWWNTSMSANSMAIRSDFSVHFSKIR